MPEVSNPSWFLRDPAFARGFMGARLKAFDNAVPHAGFPILKKWAERQKLGYTIFTSNINNFFQRAGFSSDNIQETHGNAYFLQCVDNHKCIGDIWPLGDYRPTLTADLRAEGDLPQCKHCGGLARPNILMFGDWGWLSDRSDAQKENFERQYEAVDQASDKKIVVMEIGAGLDVPTVRRFSESFLYKAPGTTVIRINPHDSKSNTEGLITLPFKALNALQELDSLLSN